MDRDFGYGYGAYGVNIDPSFDDEVLPLVDRGFVYVAHVRGVQLWGALGILMVSFLIKKNSFTLQAAAECLIEKSFTEKGKFV